MVTYNPLCVLEVFWRETAYNDLSSEVPFREWIFKNRNEITRQFARLKSPTFKCNSPADNILWYSFLPLQEPLQSDLKYLKLLYFIEELKWPYSQVVSRLMEYDSCKYRRIKLRNFMSVTILF